MQFPGGGGDGGAGAVAEPGLSWQCRFGRNTQQLLIQKNVADKSQTLCFFTYEYTRA